MKSKLIHALAILFLIVPVVALSSTKIDKLKKRSQEWSQRKSRNSSENPIRALMPEIDQSTLEEQLPITIFMYAYNNSEFIKVSLDSALNQHYRNYRIVLVDDCSTDDTLAKVRERVTQLNVGGKVQITTNKEHQGKLKVLYTQLHTYSDNEIIVLLDGRDWFVNGWVLGNLCKEYTKNDTWITFGSCTSAPKGCNIGVRNGVVPAEIMKNREFRKIFPYMPTRSFYAWLFKHINKQDLIDPQTNTFFEHATECYIMWPMIEMANTHIKSINEISYVLNCTDPIARLIEDYHLRMACNSQMGRSLPVYNEVSNPFKQ